MSSVDNRVVSITFDNDIFERRLGSTLASLDKLSESLRFVGATDGFSEVTDEADKFDLSGMGEAIDSIADKFSILGAVGFSVIQDLTTSVLDFVKSTAAQVWDPLSGGGMQRAQNIEQAKFLFEGLGMDIDASMESAKEAVLGTAYGLDAAAKAAAQLGGSGLRAGSEMTGALRGIAGVAAMTNTSFEEMADVFTSAAGKGKISGYELQRIGQRGLNAAAALAEQWGMTELEVREAASNGEISFKKFAEGMNDAFGEHATKANRTYTGSLANMRTALSRLGASFLGPHLNQQRDLFNTLTPVIDNVAKAMKPLIDTFIYLKSVSNLNLINFIKGFDLSFLSKTLPNIADGLVNIFKAVHTAIEAIKVAFTDVFPVNFGKTMIAISEAFKRFTEQLKMGGKTTAVFVSIFHGIFSIFSIIIEVGKGIVGMFKTLFSTIAGAAGVGDRKILEFFGAWGETLFALKKALVDGGGIADFFDKLTKAILNPMVYINKLKDALVALFSGKEMPKSKGAEKALDDVSGALDNLNSRFEHLRSFIRGIGGAWTWLAKKTEGVRKALGQLWDYITMWFRELGNSMKAEMNQGDFEGALDIFNVVFLGGIALALRRFFKHGFEGFGGGIIKKINGILDNVTGTLKAMQTELKAKALMRIAIAMGVLTLSIIALSMIDSAALTKALAAMSVSFGELIATMVAMDKLTTTKGAAKLVLIAGALILLAAGMTIFAVAIKVLSTLSWSELVKGLIGVGGGLAIMIKAVNSVTTDVSGLIRAGIAIIAIAIGMRILANAMQAFATMDWGEIVKGLVGVGGGLALLVKAMNTIDAKDMISAGIGIIAIAVGMRILAEAVEAFSTMSWGEMAKGLIGVGVGLAIIVALTNTMPAGGLVGIGIGLIAVGVALNIVALAVKQMADMPLGDMVKGLAGVAAILLMLVVATNAMEGSLPGAAAMVVVSGAMLVMANVLKEIGSLKIQELVLGLIGIAAVLALLGGATLLLEPVIPAMIGLGIALTLVGVGFALFGEGAYLVIKAFELLGKVGKKSMLALIEMIAIFAARAPLIGIAIARIIINAVTDLLEAAPVLVKAFKVLLLELLDMIIESAPKIGKAINALVTMMLDVIEKQVPRMVIVGWKLLLALLKGIRDNIEELTNVASDILVNFANALVNNADKLVTAALELLFTFLDAILARADDIVEAGFNLLTAFLRGIANNIQEVITAATNIIINFVSGIAQNALLIVQAGTDILIHLLFGITSQVLRVVDAITLVITTMLTALGDSLEDIAEAGTDALVAFLGAITDDTTRLVEAVGTFITNLIDEIGDLSQDIMDAGTAALIQFLDGLADNSAKTLKKFSDTGLAIMKAVADNVIVTVDKAAQIVIDFLNQLAAVIRKNSPEIRSAFANVGSAIADGITGGIWSKAGTFLGLGGGLSDKLIEGIKKKLEANSPSKVMMRIGHDVIDGWSIGMDQNGHKVVNSAVNSADNVITSFQSALSKAKASLPVLEELDPVITPVLDLTRVRSAAKDLDKMMDVSKIVPDVAIDRARSLVVATDNQNGSQETPVPAGPTEIKFEQNNYSPEALSTGDIYKQTKGQIALVKEELEVA